MPMNKGVLPLGASKKPVKAGVGNVSSIIDNAE